MYGKVCSLFGWVRNKTQFALAAVSACLVGLASAPVRAEGGLVVPDLGLDWSTAGNEISNALEPAVMVAIGIAIALFCAIFGIKLLFRLCHSA